MCVERERVGFSGVKDLSLRVGEIWGNEMYVVPPPNRADPLSGSTNGSDELMVYQTWKGSNVGFSLPCRASFNYFF